MSGIGSKYNALTVFTWFSKLTKSVINNTNAKLLNVYILNKLSAWRICNNVNEWLVSQFDY
jgi:hypothetical protein